MSRTVFVDVGANNGGSIQAFFGIGSSINAKKFGKRDTTNVAVFAFEPSCHNYMELEKLTKGSLEGKAEFHLFNDLVLDHDGEVDFCCDDGPGLTFALPEFAVASAANLPVVKKQCLDLDRLLREALLPDDYVVLKIDIEGGEYLLVSHLLHKKTFSLVHEFYLELHLLKTKWNRAASFIMSLSKLSFKKLNIGATGYHPDFFDGPSPPAEPMTFGMLQRRWAEINKKV